MKGWSEELPSLLGQVGSRDAAVEHKRVNFGVNTYLVSSLNDRDLQFSLPVLVRRDILSEFPYNPRGSDGAVAAVIEWIKQAVRRTSGLHAIAGAKTPVPGRHDANIEPCTIVHSPSQIGCGLWKADHLNFCSGSGLHLTVRGALPYGPAHDPCEIRRVKEEIDLLLHALEDAAGQVPDRIIEHEWLASLDQKLLRDLLPERGLVCFIGDGTRPARGITWHRSFYRVAGPKPGVNIPFRCPRELDPVEITLPASGEMVTGLGIREREVFAIIGAQAEGKSTLLQVVITGQDDHLTGDGREHLVTVPGVMTAEAGSAELCRADISMFFHRIPPGLDGIPSGVSGLGSGSMVMAAQIQSALRRGAPLLIFDEDRSATNLLVPGCATSDGVTPLATLLARKRSELCGTTLLFAASALDILTAQADRILCLNRHEAGAVTPGAFRERLEVYLGEVLKELKERRAHAAGPVYPEPQLRAQEKRPEE